MTELKKQLCSALRESLSGRAGGQLPEGGQLLWQWFFDLNLTRTWHMSGPNPISYQEIDAYSRLTGWPVRPDHVAIIAAMDAVFVEKFKAPKTAENNKVKYLPPYSQRPLIAELFDGMFG